MGQRVKLERGPHYLRGHIDFAMFFRTPPTAARDSLYKACGPVGASRPYEMIFFSLEAATIWFHHHKQSTTAGMLSCLAVLIFMLWVVQKLSSVLVVLVRATLAIRSPRPQHPP